VGLTDLDRLFERGLRHLLDGLAADLEPAAPSSTKH
jgi:hypothetical protein